MGLKQRTIAGTVTLDGVGVHSGEAASVTLAPAEANAGIVFRRVDLPDRPVVAAGLEAVVNTELGTTLAHGDATVRTVEHVLAALVGLGIDNVRIDVDGPELPARDGSFVDYVTALDEAGSVELDADADVLVVRDPLTVSGTAGESYVVAPADELRISATIDFAHPCIGRQYASFAVDDETFRAKLAPARTFGFEADAVGLRERGFARGASLENSIVLDGTGVMNESLRFEDEFVRHKVGDLLGDLALLGKRVRAHIVADRPSHHGNVAVARALQAHARTSGGPFMDAARIMELLPHRYPFLLVDRVLDFEAGKSIVGTKNVTINEPFFQGHFPGHPIMPGVLIVEAMAQCGGLLLLEEIEDASSKVVYFMTMDKVKFRRPVTPGDTLTFEVEVLQLRRDVCRMGGRALVDGKVAAEAEFKARIMDR